MKPCENFNKKRSPKKVMLEKNFAGVKAGQMLFVGTPHIVADYVSAIPPGETSNVIKMRNQLASRNKCDAMCPASTAIFLRIVAEFAIDEMEQGKAPAEVIPFWRIIEPGDKITKKLSIDPQWIADRRAMEHAG